MKEAKIKFVGFWDGWNPNDNFIVNALREFCNPILSDNPDYLFSSCFSDEYLKYDCVRIFYTGENMCPDFNIFDYAIGFENLDYGDRYIRYPLYLVDELYGNDYHAMLQKHVNVAETVANKTEFCSFVVSNGSNIADDIRKVFFEQLSKYKNVNSGGRYLNNINQPNGVEDKLSFQMKHKFAIAFENSSHPGYITEKLVQAFAAKTVPIYFGAPDVFKTFNKDAFIYCKDAASIEECIRYIQELDLDDEGYTNMLATPALLDAEHSEKMHKELVGFLKNIVNQDLKSAMRTNRLRFGYSYCEREMKKERLGKLVDKPYHSLISRVIASVLEKYY